LKSLFTTRNRKVPPPRLQKGWSATYRE